MYKNKFKFFFWKKYIILQYIYKVSIQMLLDIIYKYNIILMNIITSKMEIFEVLKRDSKKHNLKLEFKINEFSFKNYELSITFNLDYIYINLTRNSTIKNNLLLIVL